VGNYCGFLRKSLSIESAGLPRMTKRSSRGPGLPFLRFVFGFFVIVFYYLNGTCLPPQVKKSPDRGSDPDDPMGHASASRACLPLPASGGRKKRQMR
jgi:hypothetical protein